VSPALVKSAPESVSGAYLRPERSPGSVAASEEVFASGSPPDSRHCTRFEKSGNRMPAEWRDAGYLAAISIRYGAATPYGRFALPRIAVYWGESLSTFGSRMRETVAQAR